MTTKDLGRALLIIEHEAAADQDPVRWAPTVQFLKLEIDRRHKDNIK